MKVFESRVFRILSFVLLVLPIYAGSARAEAPAEVMDLEWCPATRNCLTWSAIAGATDYEVYRGGAGDLAGLLDEATDSCRVDAYSETTTGEALVESPPEGGLHWYLVRARDGQVLGDPGSSTAGSRVVDPSGACSTSGGLVINELDYDRPGIDSGEFVELHNPGLSARPLTGLVLILVNGTSAAEYGRVDLGQAGESLAAGAYLVVGTASVVAALPPGTLSVELSASSNNIQNGAPDGVALFDTAQGLLVDALSYEGAISAAIFDGVPGTFDLVQGTPADAVDSSTAVGALVRLPNGSDTGNALADWRFTAVPTPGMSNAP